MQKYNKAIVAVVGAVISGLSLYYGVDNEYVQIAVLIATALGVYGIPNKK